MSNVANTGWDLCDLEAVANRHGYLVPVLIGEDIVGDGLTDRAAGGDARHQQAMGHDHRLRTLSDRDAQGSVLPSVSKGDKTALRVGADEERQAAELLRANGCLYWLRGTSVRRIANFAFPSYLFA